MKLYLAPLEGLTGYIYRNAYHAYFGQVDKYFAPFIIGLYIVNVNWYPKIKSTHYITLLAEFSFYIYLLHQPIIGYWGLYAHNPVFAFSLVVALSLILMKIDTWIHESFFFKKLDKKNVAS